MIFDEREAKGVETKVSQEGPRETAVSEIFHENSKHYRSDPRVAARIIALTASPIMVRMLASRKRYRSAKKTALTVSFRESNIGFNEVLLSRRSSREFSGGPIGFSEVSQVLHFANGVTGGMETPDGHRQSFRAAPSGGALYPIEIYLVALKVEDVAEGVYHYDPVGQVLELVREGNNASELKRITYTEEVGNASAVIALTGVSLKTRLKYGERGYRFMLMEAGHIAQNILLTLSSLHLTGLPIGGFLDDELDTLLGIDGLDEVSLYLVAVGKGKKG